MTVVLCVDEKMGLSFNARRQSRDRAVRARIRQLGGRVRMNAYSFGQFAGEAWADEILVSEDHLLRAEKGDVCFVEREALLPVEKKISRVILMHWNRRYPGDTYLDLDLRGWKLSAREEFPGHSHEKITMEEYVR